MIELELSNNYSPTKQFLNFNVTFVNSTDLSILPTREFNYQQNIYYNCGDDEFKYKIQNFYNGPFLNLLPFNQSKNCSDGTCYFKFYNKDFEYSNSCDFDFE